MVRRTPELEQLKANFLAVMKEKNLQATTIVGDVGMGKSYLLCQFEKWLNTCPDEVVILRGFAWPQWRNIPYALIRDLLMRHFGMVDNDPWYIVRQELEAGFMKWMGDEGEEASHFMGQMLGFDFAQSLYLKKKLAYPKQIYEHAFQALPALLQSMAQQVPVVILLEDIHWADQGSLDMIHHLIMTVNKVPLYLVALTTPALFARRSEWGQAWPAHTLCPLSPFSAQQMKQWTATIFPTVTADMLAQVAGNPLHLKELMALVQHGVTLSSTPTTLEGVVQARVEQLPALEKRCLQQAAVIGDLFWDACLANQTQSLLTSLCDKGFIVLQETPTFAGTTEFVFQHTIYRELAYQTIPSNQRQQYHQQTADWLVEQVGDGVDVYARLIASHYEYAGNQERSAYWYGQAGKHAEKTYAYDEAAACYQLALWEDTLAPHLAIPIHEQLGNMWRQQARYPEALAAYQAMLKAAETINDIPNQARAWSQIANVQDGQGRTREMLASAEHSASLLRSTLPRNSARLARALYHIGWAHYRLGNSVPALSAGEEGLALGQIARAPQEMAYNLNLLGSVISDMFGRYDEAITYYQRALKIFHDVGNRGREAAVLNNLGEVARVQGNYTQAVQWYEQALTITREISDRDGEILFLSNMSGAQVGAGHYEKAIAQLEQLIERSPQDLDLGETYRFLTEAHLGLGQTETALKCAQRTFAESVGSDMPDLTGHAWRVLGRVSAYLKYPVTNGLEQDLTVYSARKCFNQSVLIFRNVGMEREQAMALWQWAQAEWGQGQDTKGESLWMEAWTIFQKLNLPFFVKQMKQDRKG